MSNVLVLNSGSTSVKYKLFAADETELAGGQFAEKDFKSNIKQLLRQVVAFGDIEAVGHRVVHGGWQFSRPTIVTSAVMNELSELNYLAPLHNPHNLAGIEAVADFLPQAPQIAVFDTGFFSELPDQAKTYALPRDIASKYHIRRYGFHGLSHEYAMGEASAQLGKKTDKINLVSCHLGGGSSVAAIKQGRPVDISNGYTPAEGLMMQTRTGDIDPGLVIELMYLLPGEINEDKVGEVYRLINEESGWKGLTGGICDFRDLLREVSLGQPAALAAFDVFTYRIAKYIGAYYAVLEGAVDAIVFTGAIGAGNPATRQAVMRKLRHLSSLPILAINTNEELNIARKVKLTIAR
ncbi:acetate/propionate family kinase [Candidatus Falkowbacteria bacterium]|nr:acetate/propionate family kinase [Candidatus Falkowbacteria bacterium]